MRFLSQKVILIFFCSLLFANINYSQTIKNELKPIFKNVGISKQNILNINYFNHNSSTLQKNISSKPDTVKILAIRISFQQDTLETTTGDGTFILSGNDTTIIDPPPHDRDYFLAQLDAVSHYFRDVSNKKLNIVGQVYPLDNQSSYVLPHLMDYYHPNTTDEEKDLRLTELFADAISAANDQEQIPFSEFDIFVVFHAGVGQDFADDFDTTPNDIPSAFLNKRRLQKYLGNDNPDYPGIQTNDGFIKEGIILPETQNQDGSEFALKGSFVLYLGNQLGLPSLFDTENGKPGIGAWGLMDVGSSNYFGLIPAQPIAWSKIFMGWEEPVLLEPGTAINVAVSKSINAPHIYKIPINSREYFLIENRNRDYNQDQVTTGADQFGHRLEFNPSGNFTAQIDTTLGERLGVITKVFDYDFSIPGDGILVWHIDDRIIEENYLSNTINSNSEHKGVDLEEADGSQDIGQSYGFLSPGSGSEFGVADDAFFLGNEIHQIANNVDFVSFSPSSSPSSNSYLNGKTGIVLTNFSNIDSIMSFNFSNSLEYGNFPQRFAGEMEIKFPPVIAPLNNTVNQVVFFAPGNKNIFAWNSDGSALIPNNQQLFYDDWRGNQVKFQAAVFDTVNGNFSHFPLIADINSDGQNDIICSANQNKIIIWAPILDSNTGFARKQLETNIPVEKMLIWDNNLIIAANNTLSSNNFSSQNNWGTNWNVSTNSDILNFCLTKGINSESFLVTLLENGTIQKLDQNGQVKNTQTVILPDIKSVSLVSGYLENNFNPSIILSSSDHVFAFTQDLEMISGFPVQFDEPIKMSPIISDLDQDGFGEIVFPASNKLFVINHNGTLTSGFPVELSNKFSNLDYISGSPISLLGTNQSYLFIKDALNNILTILDNGELLKNSIFSGGGLTSSPFVSLSDLNGDGLIEVIDPNADGLLNIRQLDFQNWQINGSWLQTNFNEAGTQFNPIKFIPQTTDQTEFLSYAFNYPNPTEGNQTTFRFYINKDADVKIDIFDLAGEKIETIKSSALGNVENEIIWSIDNIESGVYMARLEASDGQENAHKMIKVAVVK